LLPDNNENTKDILNMAEEAIYDNYDHVFKLSDQVLIINPHQVKALSSNGDVLLS
jgi:hypothetical protein